MANLSSTNGNMKVVGFVDNVPKIYEIIKKMMEVGYDEDFNTSFDDNISISKSGILEAKFSGTGRNCFDENIEEMFVWSKNNQSISKEEEDFLKSQNFQLIFDYCDYDPSNGFFETVTRGVHHDTDVPLEKTYSWKQYYRHVDLSLYNLMDKMGMSLEDALEDRYFEIGVEPDSEQIQMILKCIRDYYWYGKAGSLEESEQLLCNQSEVFKWHRDYIRQHTGISIRDNIRVRDAIKTIQESLETLGYEEKFGELNQSLSCLEVQSEDDFWHKASFVLESTLESVEEFLEGIENDPPKSTTRECLDLIEKNSENFTLRYQDETMIELECVLEVLEILESIHGMEVNE